MYVAVLLQYMYSQKFWIHLLIQSFVSYFVLFSTFQTNNCHHKASKLGLVCVIVEAGPPATALCKAMFKVPRTGQLYVLQHFNLLLPKQTPLRCVCALACQTNDKHTFAIWLAAYVTAAEFFWLGVDGTLCLSPLLLLLILLFWSHLITGQGSDKDTRVIQGPCKILNPNSVLHQEAVRECLWPVIVYQHVTAREYPPTPCVKGWTQTCKLNALDWSKVTGIETNKYNPRRALPFEG